ncbi:MAG: DegT/DnrJ/EryC1/StrS family aminotransferase [Pseudomonadota bacterium]|nr:DegT/DnrJ/EryC1/StrS family aminotransferase [Pseudomonadota bacterium]
MMQSRAQRHVPFAWPDIQDEDIAAVAAAVRDIGRADNRWIERFEERLSQITDSRHAIGVNSGTAALELALRALGIGPGDEVILAALGYVASANAICNAGAIPVFLDIESTGLNMDPDAIEAAVTPATRALLVTHLFGIPAAIDRIMATANRLGLTVIEDACQALGTTSGGRAAGAIGRIGAFSFSSTKPTTAGEGGAVVTNDPALAQRLRILRNQGRDPMQNDYVAVGSSARMTELAAALGWSQLGRLPSSLATRRYFAERYRAALRGSARIVLPEWNETAVVAWFGFPVRLAGVDAAARDRILDALTEAGIEARAYFQPLHTCLAHRDRPQAGNLAHCESAGRELLTLPLHGGMSQADVDRVAEMLMDALRCRHR